MVKVVINGIEKQYEEGTTFEQIAGEYQSEYNGLIGLVSVNGKIRELFKTVKKDCEVSFFTLRDFSNFFKVHSSVMFVQVS